jgi:mono/diheme cytochrome c family protein
MPFVFLALGIALGAALAAAVFMILAFGDVAASGEHRASTLRVMETGLHQSVRRHARGIDAPRLDDEALLGRGVALYREHCVQCHGAPGVAPASFAQGMRPLPANLAQAAREWTPAELFRIVKHGLKWTGMPAWKFRLPDEDIWAIVALLQRLPAYTPQAYRALEAPPLARRAAAPSAPPDAERGRRALSQYACIACHQIPGVDHGAAVGPPLQGVATRAALAGVVANTPDNLVRWLLDPQQVNPRTAMPNLGLTERDARDIVAYLSTLR